MTGSRVAGLDGLRAVACVAVVASHTAVPWLHDGWLGVDVFFVLSGWLITGLLLREIERTGRLALGRFYLRRAARLYPALILAVVLALSLGVASMDDAAVSLVYLSDLSRSVGHEIGGLSHTWSLAVEEHFYVTWPIFLLLVHRRWGRAGVAWTAAAGLVLSAGAWLVVDPPWSPRGSFGFNSPLTRGWELLAGCLLAATCREVRLSRSWRVTLGAGVPLTCTLLVLTAGQAVDLRQPVTSIAVVLVTCGLLLAVQSGGRGTSWLTVRPLPAIGRISYGIYLFHYPLTVALPHAPWPLLFPTVTASSMAVAAVSWVVIERPVLGWVLPSGTGPDQSASAAGSRRRAASSSAPAART